MKLLVLSAIFGITLSAMSYADTDKTLATSGEYQLILRTEDDGQSAAAVLTKDDKDVALDEDTFALIQKNVPDQRIALDLATQYVAREIKQAGGAQAVQAQMSKNTGTYSYLGKLARAAYAQNGVTVP